MIRFLSEESVSLHKEYVRKLKLKYSILLKSIDGIEGKSTAEILRMRLPARDLRDILSLLPEIELHEMYFTSFSENSNPTSAAIRVNYSSEGAFLNELFRLGMAIGQGFIVVNRRLGKLEPLALNDYTACYIRGTPLLALDVCEHAYFSDYGFDKERYLINALKHLDIGRVDSLMK